MAGTKDCMTDSMEDEISPPCYEDISEDEPCFLNNSIQTYSPNSHQFNSHLLSVDEVSFKPVYSLRKRCLVGSNQLNNGIEITGPILQYNPSCSDLYSTSPRQRCDGFIKDVTSVSNCFNSSVFNAASPEKEQAVIVQFLPGSDQDHSYVRFTSDLAEYGSEVGFERNKRASDHESTDNIIDDNYVDHSNALIKNKVTNEEKQNNVDLKHRYRHILIHDCSVVLTNVDLFSSKVCGTNGRKSSVAEKSIMVQVVKEREDINHECENSLTNTVIMSRDAREGDFDLCRKPQREKEITLPDAVSPEVTHSQIDKSPTRRSCRLDGGGVTNLKSIDMQVASDVAAPNVESSDTVLITKKSLKFEKKKFKTSIPAKSVQSFNKRGRIFSRKRNVRALNKKDLLITQSRKKSHKDHNCLIDTNEANLRSSINSPTKHKCTKSDAFASEKFAPALQSVQYQLARSESPMRRNCLAVAAIKNADLLNPRQLQRSVISKAMAWRKKIQAQNDSKSLSVKKLKKDDGEVVLKSNKLSETNDNSSIDSKPTDKNPTTQSIQMKGIEEIVNMPNQLTVEAIIPEMSKSFAVKSANTRRSGDVVLRNLNSSNRLRSPGKVNRRDLSVKTNSKLSVTQGNVRSPSRRGMIVENNTLCIEQESFHGKELLSTISSMEIESENTDLSDDAVETILNTSNGKQSQKNAKKRNASMKKSDRLDTAKVQSPGRMIVDAVVGNNPDSIEQVMDERAEIAKSSVAVLSVEQCGSVTDNESVTRATEEGTGVKRRGRPAGAKKTAEGLQNHSEKIVGELQNQSEKTVEKIQSQPERNIGEVQNMPVRNDAEHQKQQEKIFGELQTQPTVSAVAKDFDYYSVSTLLNGSQKNNVSRSPSVVLETMEINAKCSKLSDTNKNVNSRKENNGRCLKDKLSPIAAASTASDVSKEAHSIEDKVKEKSRVTQRNKLGKAAIRSKSDSEIVPFAKGGSNSDSLRELQTRDKTVQGLVSPITKRSLCKDNALVDRFSVETKLKVEPLKKRRRVEAKEKSKNKIVKTPDKVSTTTVNNDVSMNSLSVMLPQQATSSPVSKEPLSKSISETRLVDITKEKTRSGSNRDKMKNNEESVDAAQSKTKSIKKKSTTNIDVSNDDTGVNGHEITGAGNKRVSTTGSALIEEAAANHPVKKAKARLSGAIKLPFNAHLRSKGPKTVKSLSNQSLVLSPVSVAMSEPVTCMNTKSLALPVVYNNPWACSTSTGSSISNNVTDLCLLDDVNMSQDVQMQSVLVNILQRPGTRISLISKTLKNENGSGVTHRRYQCVFCTLHSAELREVTDHLVNTHQELLFCIVNRPRSTTASMLTPTFTFCRHCNYVAVEILPMWIHFDMFHGVSGILGPLEDEEISPLQEVRTAKNLPLMSLDAVASSRSPVYVCVDCSLWSMSKSVITSHIIAAHQDSFATSNGFFVKLFELRKGNAGGTVVPTYRQLYSDAAFTSTRAECFICITCLFVVYDSKLALEHYILAHQPKKLVLACKQRGCTSVLYSEGALNQHTKAEHADGGKIRMARLASVTILDSNSSREVKISMNRMS